MSMSAGRTRCPRRARAALPASSQSTRSRASRSATAARAASGRGGRDATSTLRGRGRRTLLSHDADLLRQRGPAHRSRVHDDHGRHHRPPSPPARRGRLLPDGHRRARRQDRRLGRARGAHAARAGRHAVGALPRPRRRARRLLRLLHPHHRPRARGRGAADPDRAARLGRRLQGQLRRLVLHGQRGVLRRVRPARGPPLPGPQDAGRVGGGGELVLPPVGLPRAPAGALRRQPRLDPAPGALQRGAPDDRAGPGGPVGVAGPGGVGRAGALGPRADDLRLDRRAPQLPHRPRVRAPGRGPGRALLAAGPAAHGQGHPQVPRRHLAGDARWRPASSCRAA